MTSISEDLSEKLRQHREAKALHKAKKTKLSVPIKKPRPPAAPVKKLAPSANVVSRLRRSLIASGKIAPYEPGGTREQWMSHLREIRAAKRLQGKK